MLKFIKETKIKNGKKYGLYKCLCGNEKEIRISSVKNGLTKSCGCLRRDTAIQNGKTVTKHGQTGTYLYYLWHSKIKHNCCWCCFDDFYKWIKPLWSEGHTLYSKNGYYDENSLIIKSEEAKILNTKNTCLKKYDTEHHLKNSNIKNKIKQTNIQKYGYESASKSDIIKQKTKENNRKKYGVDYPQQLEINRIKLKQEQIKKIGYDSELWSQKIGISRSGFNARVRKYGFDQTIIMGKYQTDIENRIETILEELNVNYDSHKKVADYFPDFILDNLIIEADGIYWHSDAVNMNYRYHKEKLNCYEKLGYSALFFRENEINEKYDIVKSIINNKLKLSKKIYARKCNIVELNLKTRKSFFNKNHLMGCGRGACFALEYNGNIVCALQYTNRNGLIDISRFCNILNTTVIGGYSRLIKCIINKEQPNIIQTFVDRRYGSGKYLYNLGFELKNEDLSFCWIKNNNVYHRLKYRGNSGYDYGCYKLWDCGQAKYIKKSHIITI